MASNKARGKVGGPKKRVARATSNIFAMFDQAQIQEFKEAFNMIDQNRDGFIDKDDLREMYASLGNAEFCPVFTCQTATCLFLFYFSSRKRCQGRLFRSNG